MPRPTTARRLALLAMALLAMALLAAPSGAQPAPVSPPEPVPPADPLLRPLSERDWTLAVRLEASDRSLSGTDPRVTNPGVTPRQRRLNPRLESITFARAAVVFPALTGTSTHTADGEISSRLRFDSFVADTTPEFLSGYQSGERLARWDAADVEGAEYMRLDVNTPMTTRSVEIDEHRARLIGWPDGPWPAVCASALQPQLGIDPSSDAVRALVERAMGVPPYVEPPYVVAKKLAADIGQRFRTTGLGYEYDRVGRFAGIELGPTEECAANMTGTPAETVALLCAAMRAAGIPARPVIGYDLLAAPEVDDEELEEVPEHCGYRFEEGDTLAQPRLTYWLEFALYDEDAGTLEWVPVDILRQRRLSSRLPALSEPWRFFGNHTCADLLLPISHHFFPPTTVVGMGAPLMWGWMAEPAIPRLDQTLNMWAHATVITTPTE